MKRRLLLPVAAVVVAAHALFFFVLPGIRNAAPSEEAPLPKAPPLAADGPATPSSTEPPAEAGTASPEAEPPFTTDAGEAVGKAVGLVKGGRDRAASSDERPGAAPPDLAAPSAATDPPPPGPDDPLASEAPEADVLPEGAIPEGAMRVGRAGGLSQLPPEVAGPAQEGALAVAAEDWESARRHYLEMVRLAPNNALGYANLGVAEYQLGNLLAASGNLKKSLDINPSIAGNWQTLGLIHYERGELEMAISSLTRALHEDPSDPRSRVFLAAVIRDYGWLEAAITELQRAVETDPGLADAHFNLALTYLEESPPRLELARRHYYAARDLGVPPSEQFETLFASPETGAQDDPETETETSPGQR